MEFMGGADAVVAKARESFDAGDFRWVAEVVNHVVFAQPDHAAARELLADTYEQLGYGAECGTWRTWYLSGATELRHGQFGTPTETNAPDVIAQLTPSMLFDAIAIQVNGPAGVGREPLHRRRAHRPRPALPAAAGQRGAHPQRRSPARRSRRHPHHDTTGTTRAGRRAPRPTSSPAAGIEVTGDASVLARLVAVLDPGDKNFAIVTP